MGEHAVRICFSHVTESTDIRSLRALSHAFFDIHDDQSINTRRGRFSFSRESVRERARTHHLRRYVCTGVTQCLYTRELFRISWSILSSTVIYSCVQRCFFFAADHIIETIVESWIDTHFTRKTYDTWHKFAVVKNND